MLADTLQASIWKASQQALPSSVMIKNLEICNPAAKPPLDATEELTNHKRGKVCCAAPGAVWR